MISLKTKRLVIQTLDLSDWPMICQFANDESINRNLSFGSIATETGAKDYIATAIAATKSDNPVSYKLKMMIKPHKALFGSCWLDVCDTSSSNASIGYFVDKQHWGNGYATEMVDSLINFGFRDLKLHRIYAHCDADNLASRHVLKKVGMQPEGILREHCLRRYGWVDICYYGILQSEWLGRSNREDAKDLTSYSVL